MDTKAGGYAESLKAQHESLEEKIRVERLHDWPDQMLLQQLRKEKLLIKEQIVGIGMAGHKPCEEDDTETEAMDLTNASGATLSVIEGGYAEAKPTDEPQLMLSRAVGS